MQRAKSSRLALLLAAFRTVALLHAISSFTYRGAGAFVSTAMASDGADTTAVHDPLRKETLQGHLLEEIITSNFALDVSPHTLHLLLPPSLSPRYFTSPTSPLSPLLHIPYLPYLSTTSHLLSPTSLSPVSALSEPWLMRPLSQQPSRPP